MFNLTTFEPMKVQQETNKKFCVKFRKTAKAVISLQDESLHTWLFFNGARCLKIAGESEKWSINEQIMKMSHILK